MYVQENNPRRSTVQLTYAGGNVGATLLIAACTAVASESRDAVLAGALTAGAVADLSRRADRMALAGCGREIRGTISGG